MNLYIDSTDNLKTIIRLDNHEYIREITSPREQDIAGFLMRCLTEENKTPEDITSISVNPGPGSFTGSRIGVTIGNALAFALGKKINDQNPPIEPIYSSPPNITTPVDKRKV